MTELVDPFDLVAVARALATRAHEGQVDKAGRPYVEHPARVAARVAATGGDAQAQAAAWLHDVLEDTPLTRQDLARVVPEPVLGAVEALTRRAGQEPDAYYAQVAAHPIARAVKLADLADNTDPARLALLDAPTRARLEAKYAHARAALGAAPT